ncbi:hypothetical protein [Malacoplasma iowae]|uniref:Uncharacterized protein n=2 Tax=Malacoplasma iowae TaxID=2116 RepID=A0A084U4W4_MALIO|nr:hypothetical protein [Malacoplasma iowae]VEU63072.1 Uncharacterised protein [Mycoplasmopsis fermentans]EGZ30909.1 hypothetical protein GUU_04514 [Malacoplasma iowae 695]KFB08000.1 hypothetical protein P271_866 [Malacoplasma iowae DK-CPA]QHG89516.1 hypothetical protein EER00_01205 [Malacoplasma iowae 695]WPL35708.1 hypothetical protein QX180_05290 [Malacoplasma iowae]
MNKTITVSQIGDSYKVNIRSEGSSMSTGYMIGMIIGFFFFLIIGIIMLIMWLMKNNDSNNVNVDIVLPKDNWENELDKQLLIYNFGSDTDKIKLEITNKIKILNV